MPTPTQCCSANSWTTDVSDVRRNCQWRNYPSDPGVGAAEPEVRLTLLAGLHRLSPNRRAVLVLRYWEDLSVETVAAAMSLTPGAVKALTLRSLAELRSVLGMDLAALSYRGASLDQSSAPGDRRRPVPATSRSNNVR